MPRCRNPPMGAKGESTAEENRSRINPAASRLWPRGPSVSSKASQKVKVATLDHRPRETPKQPAPLTPARSFHYPSAPTSTRKISASFSTDCSLSGHPTIACSAVTASITKNHPDPPSSHQGDNAPSALTSSQSCRNINTLMTDNNKLKPSNTFSNLPIPTSQHKAPSSKPSIATAYTNARALPGRNAENLPPSASMASLAMKKQSKCRIPTPRLPPKPSPSKKTVKSRLTMSKSRTFSVFSNFTASFSRTSLSQFTGSDSRSTSISSKSTTRKDPAPYTNSQSASSTSSQALPNQTSEAAANPHKVHTAQTSAYWAGRFMALQDRFQSETLVPENLATLVHAHAQRSLIPVAQPSLASSATTGCIMPAARPNKSATTRRTTAGSTSPRKRQQQQRHHSSASRAAPPLPAAPPPPPPKIPRSMTTAAPPRPSNEKAAALLVDEDNRCRRIFLHLDGLCTTSEARLSLQQWQQAYARRMGKEHLFSIQRNKTRELTWVGRLLIGSGSGHSKKGGLGL